ncbi:MAG: HAMP domain-containing protein [Burkholderiales bacterium]|nr:HAMP domain-containing protein [Burkholderiales bacterium]
MRFVLVACVSLGAVALAALALASADTALFAEYYPALLMLNGAVAATLTALVIYQLVTLRRRLRRGVFGSKLTLRLVLLFALMAIIPGVLIYALSVQFMTRSIEAWFDVRVDRALEGGINIGRSALDAMLKELAARGEQMALALSSRPPEEHIAALNALREQSGVQEAALLTERGRVVAFSGDERAGLLPDAPGPAMLRQLRAQQAYRGIEAIPERGLYLRVLAPVRTASIAAEPLVLQLLQPVPAQLAQDAEFVQSGYREYQEITLARRGLKRVYGLTLTLTLLLALLSALALAVVLSERLSAPLNVLVEGTRAVAQGDFSRQAAVASTDELGLLTQSFNSMTQQLAEARAAAERHQGELAQANAYLASILANLSAGVLAFDDESRLRSANRSAGTLLGVDFEPLIALAPGAWDGPALAEFAAVLARELTRAGAGEWERQIERDHRGGRQQLLVRGSRLPRGAAGGSVVVFDDITHLAQAQRAAAWAEVARRLAHEIRNPLTPIQLSAERLEAKLAGKLDAADSETLARSTRTIVNQVAALKGMVEAFSKYARTPEPSVRELDLNALIHEVLTLYEASLGRCVELELAAGLPRVAGDAGQLRQVMHNLLQNAQDALAETTRPRVVIATTARGDTVELTVADNGTGFPEHMLPRAFEPYVTSKPRGTGLGLAIVRKIVEEHRGTARVANVAGGGARVTLTFPAAGAGSREPAPGALARSH